MYLSHILLAAFCFGNNAVFAVSYTANYSPQKNPKLGAVLEELGYKGVDTASKALTIKGISTSTTSSSCSEAVSDLICLWSFCRTFANKTSQV